MRSILRNFFVAASTVCLFSLATAQAGENLKVQLPVKAHFGQATLAEGDYKIRTSGGETLFLIVESADGESILVPVMRIGPAAEKSTNDGELVLTRQGDDYRVIRIYLNGRSYGYEILPFEPWTASKQ